MQIVFEIINWYEINFRPLPWRATNDPYKIWLSEIILQQTQVVQGISYYEKFISKYPTIFHLADANEEEILKLWQGLGYYSRARNLLKTAKTIKNDFNGSFPTDYNQIIKLSGIGQYTASAIASFAFNQAYPVLDGNVFRFISRLYGIDAPIDVAKNRTLFLDILNLMIEGQNPAIFNNAIMEMGAIICKPQNPKCEICAVRLQCIAFKTEKISAYPVKTKIKSIKNRYFNYLLIKKNNLFLMEKRTEKDIWQNLFQLPLIESTENIDKNTLKNMFAKLLKSEQFNLIEHNETYKHQLTHQQIHAKIWIIEITAKNIFETANMQWVDKETYKKLPIPSLIEKILVSLQHQL